MYFHNQRDATYTMFFIKLKLNIYNSSTPTVDSRKA